jgi:hypothetical protein
MGRRSRRRELWADKKTVRPEIWEKLYKNKISKEKKWKKKKRF